MKWKNSFWPLVKWEWLLQKTKDHFTISWNCSIIEWLSFTDEFWICDNHLFFKQSLFRKWWLKLIRTNLKILQVLMLQFKVFFYSKVSNTCVRIEGNEKTLFDHWSNENDCFKKHKDHFTISWNCGIIVWLSFRD